MGNKKKFWISLSLVNLFGVALLGFMLRSKILFSLPFIDYKNLLSAHSHFAFGGWAALVLVTLLVYDLLEAGDKKIYQWILWGIQITSWGMALTFPFTGYALLSIIFSTGHIVCTYVFAFAFINDVLKRMRESSLRWLSITGVLSLVLSSIGPFGLAYTMATKSGDANLHRDLIYTFLHFQYNGFFTLTVLALFVKRVLSVSQAVLPWIRKFSIILSLSILPTLFLSMLWHNAVTFYVIAIVGCCLLVAALFYFARIFLHTWKECPFTKSLSRSLFTLSFLSLGLKLLLQIGPVIPGLGTAVYGDRPLIIGYLHLVFLAFVTLFVLCTIVEDDHLPSNRKGIRGAFIVFTFGVIANELLLMLQGLGILFFYNTSIYTWLLWFNSIILVIGSGMIASVQRSTTNKPSIEPARH